MIRFGRYFAKHGVIDVSCCPCSAECIFIHVLHLYPYDLWESATLAQISIWWLYLLNLLWAGLRWLGQWAGVGKIDICPPSHPTPYPTLLVPLDQLPSQQPAENPRLPFPQTLHPQSLSDNLQAPEVLILKSSLGQSVSQSDGQSVSRSVSQICQSNGTLRSHLRYILFLSKLGYLLGWSSQNWGVELLIPILDGSCFSQNVPLPPPHLPSPCFDEFYIIVSSHQWRTHA